MCQRIDDRFAYDAPESCDCSDCMPEGADGSMEDALDAAMAKLATKGVRGKFTLRTLAKTVAVSWTGEGSRSDIDREALREAAHCLRRAGRVATLVPGAYEMFAA